MSFIWDYIMYPFTPASTHMICGQSGAGKSVHVYKMLQNLDNIFGDNPPTKVKYFYGIWTPLYDEMKQTIKDITFQKDLPTLQELDEFTDPNNHTLCVLDDVMHSAVDSEVVELIFTRISHHRNLSCLYLVQNIFPQGKRSRNISLNTKYLHLFSNPRDLLQIKCLGSQLYPGKSEVMVEAYQDCLKQPYGYLIVDLTPHTPHTHRLRTSIFENESTIVYVPK